MILKIGSNGKEVKELQEFLEIQADGIFGKGTDAAVRKWQQDEGLVVDGIVGPATWNSMGLASTDISEQVFETENGLIIKKHYLPKGEYKVGPTKKEYIFLHHTAGGNNPFSTINRWGRDDRGAIATEFVLGGQSIKGNDDQYDGVMVQAFPEGAYGWHLGPNGSQHMHTHSVGIELNNFGYIVNGKTYVNTVADELQIVTLKEPFRGYKTWHRYSDKQIENLRLWLLWIAERDNIDIREGLPSLIKEKGAKAFDFNPDAYYGKIKGVWTHTNTRRDKFDMFPQDELLEMLTNL